MRILDFGSLNLDSMFQVDHFVSKGETLKAKSVAIHCGGKGLNQALAAARAGSQVYMAGCIGRDGDVLLETLRQASVNCRYVCRFENANTGQAIIQNDPSGDNCILLDPGANYWITPDQIDDVLASFEPGDILLCQNEISNMDALLEKARAQGLLIYYNPAPMTKTTRKRMQDGLGCLVVNEGECRQLLDLEESLPQVLIQEFGRQYPHTPLLLTLGDAGAIYCDENRICQVEACKVPVIDTTGAGDTFIGYFASSRAAGKSVEEALQNATAASALSVQKRGAADSIPSQKQVAVFLAEHSIPVSTWQKVHS